MGTGHLFDVNVMRPVFRNGRIAGYTMSITHLPDIGGLGFGAAATEIFHEGLRLPICKLARSGRLDEPMLDVIRANVRVPEQVFGDLMANIACNEVGARQLLEFMDEYGLDDLAPLSARHPRPERAGHPRPHRGPPRRRLRGCHRHRGHRRRASPRLPRRGRRPGHRTRLRRHLAPRRPGHQRAAVLHARHGPLTPSSASRCRRCPTTKGR